MRPTQNLEVACVRDLKCASFREVELALEFVGRVSNVMIELVITDKIVEDLDHHPIQFCHNDQGTLLT